MGISNVQGWGVHRECSAKSSNKMIASLLRGEMWWFGKPWFSCSKLEFQLKPDEFVGYGGTRYIYIYAQRPPLDPQFPCVFHRTSWSYRATDASARICQQQSSYIILYLQFEHVIIIHEQDSRHENWALLETPPTRKQGELRVLAQSRCLAIHWWRHGSVFAQTKLM